MDSSPPWTYQDAADLRDHWWWRPGWGVGTRFYAWHVTFDDDTDLHRLVDTYQEALYSVGGLDLIPREWLHLTMQGVGHVEDTPETTVADIVAVVREKFAIQPPIEVTFHRPVIRAEAIVLPPAPLDGLHLLRQVVRDGMGQVVGPGNAPEQAVAYEPHVSLAYANTQQSAAHVRAALDTANTEPAAVTLNDVSLIRMHRDQRMYEWTTESTVELGPVEAHDADRPA